MTDLALPRRDVFAAGLASGVAAMLPAGVADGATDAGAAQPHADADQERRP